MTQLPPVTQAKSDVTVTILRAAAACPMAAW